MADVKVRIEVNPNAESEILGNVVNNSGAEEVSNVSVKTDSKNIFTQVPTQADAVKGINGLSLGQDLVFDSEGYLDNQDLKGAVIEDEQNPYEFIWGFVPSNGKYSVKLTFTNAQNLKDIIIYGDSVVGQFPTRAIINETTEIYSYDNRWVINLQEERETHTIEFTDWNRPNYNACLSLISVMLQYYDVDKLNGLKGIESLSESTGQTKEIFYGCIANSGSAEIIDINGEILEMLESGIIENSNVPIELIVNGNLIQTHLTNDSEYNINTKNFTVSMTNDISNWDNITFLGKPLFDGTQSAYDIVLEIMTSLGFSKYQVKNRMLSNTLVYGSSNQVGTIKEYLELIKIPYPYLSSATYRETIDKICQVAQLQVYADNDGMPIFVSARPIVSQDMLINAIHIPKKYMESNLQKSVILKNKYDGIDMDEKVVTRTVVSDGKCGSSTHITSGYETESDTATVSRVKGDKIYEMSLKLYFKSFTATIPAKSNLNLNTAYNIQKFSSVSNVGNNLLIEDIKTYNYYIEDLKETITISPEIISEGASATSFLQEKINNVKYNETDDTFTISFVACVGRDCSTIIPVYAQDDIVLETQSYRANSITFTFFGEQLQIDFENQDVSSSNSAYAKTIINLNSNELMQSDTQINGVKISTQIKNNIFNDYINGISNGNVNLFCGDMYYRNGTLAKLWSKGEILNVNDIVYFDNDIYLDKTQRYWRIVGREISNRGVPKLYLELQEIKQI